MAASTRLPSSRGDASETEWLSLERTQQRIELLEKTANFHCMKQDTIAALREQSRGALSIHISCKALSGASLEIGFRECAVSIWFGGRHSRHGWERRPRSFS